MSLVCTKHTVRQSDEVFVELWHWQFFFEANAVTLHKKCCEVLWFWKKETIKICRVFLLKKTVLLLFLERLCNAKAFYLLISAPKLFFVCNNWSGHYGTVWSIFLETFSWSLYLNKNACNIGKTAISSFFFLNWFWKVFVWFSLCPNTIRCCLFLMAVELQF